MEKRMVLDKDGCAVGSKLRKDRRGARNERRRGGGRGRQEGKNAGALG